MFGLHCSFVGSLLYFLSCTCRYKALESMWELLPYVVETLDEMRTDENFRSDRDDALRHINSITFTSLKFMEQLKW